MLLNKRDLMATIGARGGFIFLNDPMKGTEIIANRTYLVDLTKENSNNLYRYSTKLKYDQGIQPSYDKHIKTILGEYLDEVLTEKDKKEMEGMLAEEKRAIEQQKEKEKPKFDWDLSNKDKKGNK